MAMEGLFNIRLTMDFFEWEDFKGCDSGYALNSLGKNINNHKVCRDQESKKELHSWGSF